MKAEGCLGKVFRVKGRNSFLLASAAAGLRCGELLIVYLPMPFH